MIQLLVSILVLITAVSVAYLLTIIDSIVHGQLYQFSLQFSHVWADPYWMFLRISLALLGLVAVVALMNITYFLWMKLRVTKIARAKASRPDAAVPSMFQCTSCGRSMTHPLRMLDFHSQTPKMINICPFCNATAVPVGCAYTEEATSAEEEDEDEEVEKKERDYIEVEVRKEKP